jgi:hypothetical protein
VKERLLADARDFAQCSRPLIAHPTSSPNGGKAPAHPFGRVLDEMGESPAAVSTIHRRHRRLEALRGREAGEVASPS